MKTIAILLFSFVNSICSAQDTLQNFSYPAPDSLSTLKKLSLWSTWYHIHSFRSGGAIPLRDQNGNPTGLFADTCNFCKAAIEGTAAITDSTGKIYILNFAGRSKKTSADCRQCPMYANSKLNTGDWGKILWIKTTGYGKGVQNYALVPFRTIAVDPQLIPYGTILFIPAVKGKSFLAESGQRIIHDGYFFAGDTGSAIKDNHIDLFTGMYSRNPFPAVVTSASTGIFEAFVVTNPSIIKALAQLHTR